MFHGYMFFLYIYMLKHYCLDIVDITNDIVRCYHLNG
jgi:hypothetical protein